jgi:hypothetical protein
MVERQIQITAGITVVGRDRVIAAKNMISEGISIFGIP